MVVSLHRNSKREFFDILRNQFKYVLPVGVRDGYEMDERRVGEDYRAEEVKFRNGGKRFLLHLAGEDFDAASDGGGEAVDGVAQ